MPRRPQSRRFDSLEAQSENAATQSAPVRSLLDLAIEATEAAACTPAPAVEEPPAEVLTLPDIETREWRDPSTLEMVRQMTWTDSTGRRHGERMPAQDVLRREAAVRRVSPPPAPPVEDEAEDVTEEAEGPPAPRHGRMWRRVRALHARRVCPYCGSPDCDGAPGYES